MGDFGERTREFYRRQGEYRERARVYAILEEIQKNWSDLKLNESVWAMKSIMSKLQADDSGNSLEEIKQTTWERAWEQAEADALYRVAAKIQKTNACKEHDCKCGGVVDMKTKDLVQLILSEIGR